MSEPRRAETIRLKLQACEPAELTGDCPDQIVTVRLSRDEAMRVWLSLGRVLGRVDDAADRQAGADW